MTLILQGQIQDRFSRGAALGGAGLLLGFKGFSRYPGFCSHRSTPPGSATAYINDSKTRSKISPITYILPFTTFKFAEVHFISMIRDTWYK